jgi:Asp-tRNA(Asn)/Glu-tRNA(Gln) amidotransferase A subunit family amidase
MMRLLTTALAGASMLAVADLPQGRAEMQARQVELLEATVPQLQAALTAGTVTSRDLVAMYLARIDAYDQRGPALNAISLTNGNALIEADARDAERRAGAPRRALHGIPVIVKDNYETANMQTAAGSRARGLGATGRAFLSRSCARRGNHHRQVEHARVRLRHHHARLAVRSDPQPLCIGPQPRWFQRRHRCRYRRQFRRRRHGSDTCGSIRIPASHNSLVGIRRTQARQPQRDHPLSSTQDIGGPIARSVTDLAIVLDATVGYDPADPQTAASVGNIPKSYTDYLQLTALRGARLGLVPALLGTDPADAEVAAVVRGAVEEMKGQGAEIVEVSIPGLTELLTDRANGFLITPAQVKFDLNA